MSKFEMIVLSLMGAALVSIGWVDDGGWLNRTALLMGGIVLGAVMVFALDEGVGDE